MTISESVWGVKILFKLACFEPLMGAMWFCPALLIASLLSFGMMKITEKHTSIRHYVFIGAAFVGAVCCQLHIKSPYCLWQYLQVCIIFYMGFVFRQFEFLFKKAWIKIIFFFISVLGLLLFTWCGIMAHLQPDNISKENVLMLMIIALIGCIGVYCMSSLLSELKIGKLIASIGDYSFSIMALHFIAFKVVILLQCYVYEQSFSKLSSFPCLFTSNYWWVAYTFVGVLLPIIVSKGVHIFINKFKVYKINE